MSHSPVGGAPFLSLGGGLLSYEDTGHGGGMTHIQDLSSPSEGHQLQGDSDSEYNDDYAQQLDDAAANEESDEENSDGGDDQAADSEEDEDEAEDEEASDPESENEDDAGDEDDEDASDDPQQEQGGGAGPNSFRRARSTMNRRGRQFAQRSESAEQDDDDDDLGYAMRLQRQINNTSANRRRSTRAAAQKKPVYADSMDEDDPSENEDDSEEGGGGVKRIDRQINGLRSRPSRRAASAAIEAIQQKPKVVRKGKKKGAGRATRGTAEPRRPNRTTRTSNQAIQRPKYAETSDESSDSASETEKQEKREALQKEMVSGPCKANGYYISPYPEDLDDEVERVLGHRDMEGVELDPVNPWLTREFHIKWKRYAFIHSSWDTLATLQQLPGIKRVQNYMKRVDELTRQTSYLSPEELELINVERQMQEQLVEDHMMVERIIEEFVEGDETKYLVKWGGLPYMENTWEVKEAVLQSVNGEQAIDEYQERESRILETTKTVDGQRKSFLMKGHRALTVQPKFLAGGELRDYQLNGLNWLVYSWLQNNNVILADEMGLGKTIQCVSFCAYLAHTLSILGPFLVIVPLSTVHNWVKEFAKWAPQVNTVVYVGDTVSRGVARRYEFETNRRTGRQQRFEVMITTFEVVLKDAAILNKIKWNFMLMDEAHRLKNHESALYQELMTWHFKNKLLVTGTPLQNSIQELWALLHFLEPFKFDNMEGFIEEHSLDTDEGVRSLHAELGPHLLRRVIKDVEKSLPPKNERILRVEMTPLQKQYYKWILNRNFAALNKGARGSGHVSLLNIITELKKTCNHPFLFESAEESYRGRDDENAVDRLVTTSGKMVILDKLMQRLKATGHRVLIFSQMVRVLDIISDYLRLRGYCHQRLDGSTSPIARQQAMSHFNAEGSPDFAFLLSTRAGGLGINLATADTVIIFDSDWNPQNDLQAMSRAHRIGQKDTVNIYRFVTSGSVEENILERAKQKMVLDHVVIQRMDTSGRMVLDPRSSNQSAKMFDKEELSAILRFGAEKLFKTGGEPGEEENKADEEEQAQALYEESIDDILARAEKVETSTAAAAEGGANELLNQFNYATFKNEEDDATFWSRLIPVEKRVEEEEEEELLPRQARLKVERGDLAEAEVESPKSKRRERREGRGPTKGKAMQAGPPLENCHRRVEEVATGSGEEAGTVSLNKKEALAFVRAVRKFGTTERMEDIVAEAGPHVGEELDSAAHIALYSALLNGCREAVKIAEEVRANEAKEEPATTGENSKPEKKPDPQLDFFGVSVKAADLVTIVEKLDMLHKKLRLYSERPAQYRLETASQLSAPKWGSLIGWTPRDDAMLLMGVHLHGLGNWDKVVNDPMLGLEEKLGAKRAEEAGDSSRLPKGSHLETRALGLLKKMEALMRKPPKVPTTRPDKAARRPVHSKAAARLKRESSVSESDLKGAGPRRQGGMGRPKSKAAGGGRAGKAVDNPEQALEDVRVTMKKLRTLQRHKDIPKDQAIAKTKKYLKVVGKHIDDVAGGHSQQKLWSWVAKFTENPLPGERMMKLYRKIAGLDLPPGGSHGGGGEDRRERSSEPAGATHRSGDTINKRAAVGDGGRGGEGGHHHHHHKRPRMERTNSADAGEFAHGERHRSREYDRDRQRELDRQQADRERSRNFDISLQRDGSMATAASGTLQSSGSGTISRRAPVR